MKITKMSITKYLKEATIGAILWEAFLTPYSVLVEKLSALQFAYWTLMEFVLVLPLAPIVFEITKFTVKRWK